MKHGSVPKRSNGTDCKSVGLVPSKVRILPGPPLDSPFAEAQGSLVVSAHNGASTIDTKERGECPEQTRNKRVSRIGIRIQGQRVNVNRRTRDAKKRFSMKKYFTYLARCSDNTLYTGYCTDVSGREAKHNAGEGARYTRSRRPVKIVYWEEFQSRSEAMRRESQIKRWSRVKKELLINK